jgi:Tfp pilus assembly protein PilF
MAYHFVHQKYGEYSSLKLNDQIDNKIAAKKAKLLEDLEKGYQSVMNYKSPDWGLVACYRSYEVNKEFSEFLKKSPLPDLTPEEKKQYSDLIRQKAEEYNKKADQYLKTCIELAHKWEICDPKLAAFFNKAFNSDAVKSDLHCFSGSGSSIEIASRSLNDQKLKSLHGSLIQNPDNKEILAELSEVYIKKGDFRQALLITQNTLSEMKEQKGAITARFYNNLGISQLYIGNDVLAKEAFKKALDIDSESIGAKINLAGLYSYYGHTAKAAKIYGSLPKSDKLDKLEEIIHPRARELYYVQSRISKEKG